MVDYNYVMEIKSGESLTLYFMKLPNMKKQILKFRQTQSVYRCPICSANLFVPDEKSSFLCENKHCFDISAKGYVNFLQNRKRSKYYDNEFFTSRREFADNGFYSHISDEIFRIITESSKDGALRIADAGCGEGSFALSLAAKLNKAEFYAFDFSKDAVHIAARGGNDVLWMASDIANIPLKDNCVDFVLNIYSPANYSEFKRILKKNGTVIKIIPGANHMIELREHRGAGEYSNEQVAEIFIQNLDISDRYTISRSFEINENQLENVLNMTPLMFGAEVDLPEFRRIKRITVEAEILISKTI